jgi:hypothetical protein
MKKNASIKRFGANFRPDFERAPYVKMALNIGALMDIPTGAYERDYNGHWIMNGGLAYTTGLTGLGNSFKTCLGDYMMHEASSRIFTVAETYMMTYDTENNTNMAHKIEHAMEHDSFKDINVLKEGIWEITDKQTMWADEWFVKLKDVFKNKNKNKRSWMVKTPYLGIDRKTPFMSNIPTTVFVDSMTDFETGKVNTKHEKLELGDNKGRTMYMDQGLDKAKFMRSINTIAQKSDTYMLFTAHVGKETEMGGGRPGMPPPKKLSTMRPGEKLKGATDAFFFSLHNLWQIMSSGPLYNPDSMCPLYPIDPEDGKTKSQDLMKIFVKLLRSKNGGSGTTLTIIMSQTKGVLPTLTEFHYIKTEKYYGLSGGNRNYNCDLYPAVSMSRTTVRSKIDSDPRLRRAINICSDMLQIRQLRKYKDTKQMCTPGELFYGLEKLGYDWDKILDTRGWYTINNDDNPIMSVSTLTLLDMRLERIDIPKLKKKSK